MVDSDNNGAVRFWEAMGFELDADQRWSLLLCASGRPHEVWTIADAFTEKVADEAEPGHRVDAIIARRGRCGRPAWPGPIAALLEQPGSRRSVIRPLPWRSGLLSAVSPDGKACQKRGTLSTCRQ